MKAFHIHGVKVILYVCRDHIGCGDSNYPPIMENQMEKKMETEIILGFSGVRVPEVSGPLLGGHHKDYSTLRSISGAPCFRKFPCGELADKALFDIVGNFSGTQMGAVDGDFLNELQQLHRR